MKQHWEKLEAFLQSTHPALLADLAPPATNVEIAHLQRALGVALPADFIDCLKIHNGQHGKSSGLFGESEFLSTSRILEEWEIWKGLFDSGDFDGSVSNPECGIRSAWWTPGWVPFTYNGSGDHLCLDLDPTIQGTRGQIITLWHDDEARVKKADSFTQWFAGFVDTL